MTITEVFAFSTFFLEVLVVALAGLLGYGLHRVTALRNELTRRSDRARMDRADLLAANQELGDTVDVLRAKVDELLEAREGAA